MISFINWLSSNTNAAIAETEAIPYPTSNLKLLKKEPKYIVEQGKEMFYQLVMMFTPKLLILHGKKTVNHTLDIFCKKGLLSTNNLNLDVSVEEMETKSPLLEFEYPNGKKARVLACRHFMYYGSEGKLFQQFGENVLMSL